MPVQTQEVPKLAKPEGGYCSIPVLTLGLLWWAYTKGLLTLRAVRVGLALFELRIRRAAYVWTEKRRGNKTPDFSPRYSAKEIGEAHPGFRGATRRPITASSTALPRLRMLCTSSKKPK